MKRFIYSLICPISNEIKYIGQTKRSLHERLNSHIHEFNRSVRNQVRGTHKTNWMSILKKEGLIQKIKINLIEECDVNTVDEREIYWIDYYSHLNLTNSSPGGSVLSEETIRKISESKQGNKNPMFGKKIPQLQRDKMVLGIKNSTKLRESRKSTEYRKKISDAFSKTLIVLNEDYTIVGEFKNSRTCAEFFGFKKSNILHAVKDNRKIGRSMDKKYWVMRKDDYQKQFI